MPLLVLLLLLLALGVVPGYLQNTNVVTTFVTSTNVIGNMGGVFVAAGECENSAKNGGFARKFPRSFLTSVEIGPDN